MPFHGAPWAHQDAYARLPFDPARVTASDLHAGSLTFLDLASTGRGLETLAGYLDAVPAWLLARPAAVLIRWYDEEDIPGAADRMRRQLDLRGLNVAIGLVSLPVGLPPRITWDGQSATPTPGHDAALLNRARRVELGSYLHWGGAVWRPSGYHYCFPSGRHARTYVRLADAFVDIHAPRVLATWLARHLTKGGTTAVVAESGTLSPLLTELRALAQRSEGDLAPVIGIDSYPASPLGMQQRLRKLTDGIPTLGLVSVSDTGELAAQLADVIRSTAAEKAVVEQLVSRRGHQASEIPTEANGVLDPWLALDSQFDEPSDPPCGACRDPGAAPLVRIDPRSMSALVLPNPTLLMPDLTDARRNASLWETYDHLPTGMAESSWIGLTGPTGTRPGLDGLDEPDRAALFFEPALIARADGNIMARRKQQIGNLPARRRDDPELVRISGARTAIGDDARVVIIDRIEWNLFPGDARSGLMKALSPFVAANATYFEFLPASGAMPILNKLHGPDEPAEPGSVLMVALGLRSGVTLHRTFLAARQRWPSAEQRGLVVHAHPNDDRVWASIRNTFTDSEGIPRLLALWLTYLPRWSPFAEEAELLNRIATKTLTDKTVKQTLDQRRRNLASGHSDMVALWGPPNIRLKPGSFLGEELGATATFTAVGAAIQSARLRARPEGSPHWAVVDLPRTFRSYFDALIHVAVLRWCQPEECWWGEHPGDCIQLIHEVRHQMQDEWPLLLPELLLAAIQGKLPPDAVQEVVTLSQEALTMSNAWAITDQRAREFLTLGLALHALAPQRPVSS